MAKFIKAKLSEPQKAAVIKVLDSLSKAGIAEVDARLAIQILIPSWNSKNGGGSRMLFQRVSGWQGNVYLERIVSEQVSIEHENFRDTVFFGSLYGDHSMNNDGFMDKLIASDYWTEKFIEWAGHSCYDEKSLDVVTKKFKDFLVSRCKSGMDIFCNDIDQIKFYAVNRIIRQLNQTTNNPVFNSFFGNDALQS